MKIDINPQTQQAYQLFHDGILALSRAEKQGIRVDMRYLKRKQKQLTNRIEKNDEKFKKTDLYKAWKKKYGANINLNSDPQLGEVLYNVLNYTPYKTTKTGRGKVDKEALEYLEIEALDILLETRRLKKIRDTYLAQLVREQSGRVVHPFFNLHTVSTFRSSSNAPNFQNIPKREKDARKMIRSALYPREGHQLMAIDFSKLEVSIAACYHKDPTMLNYLKSDSSDMHGDMTEQIFIMDDFDTSIPEHSYLRSAIKNSFVFPQFYGDYYKNNALSIAKWLKLPNKGRWKPGKGVNINKDQTITDHLHEKGIKTFDHFVDHLKDIEDDFWNNRFPAYKKWKDFWYSLYQKYGYVDMLTKFRVKGYMKKNEVINYPVQGSAFHCLLWSFIELDKVMRLEDWKTRLIGQIHDEVVLDVHPDEKDHVLQIAKKITTVDLPKAWDWIIVPLDIDAEIAPVDRPWSEMVEIEI
jgi:DNA polymerase-1